MPDTESDPSEASYGARWIPVSVTIAAISTAGVTSNAGLRAGKRSVTSAGSRSSIGIPAPVGRGEVDGGRRRDDVERDPVVAREHRQRIGADLVRRVPVRRDPVGAGDDAVDLPRRHPRRRGRVGDDREREAEAFELPGREPRALEERPRLVDPHERDEPFLPRPPDRADGGAVAAGGEPAGIAVGEDARAGREELDRVRGHAPAAVDLSLVERTRPRRRGVVPHRVERPDEVRGRRPGGRENRVRGVEVLTARGSEREAVGAGDADRRRPADHHVPDRGGDLSRGAAAHLDLLLREPALVEQNDRAVLEAGDGEGVELASQAGSLPRSERSRRRERMS